ncbi:unnamed protein product [Owenia fusiformis]|uniref:Protein sleepless n=1 Tax=Owenia fusiformis TaxID=6347 RepID=A0A8S4PVG0_OWEFU|nr:unnamed protein product [Owenia fusiformis]
MVYCNVTHDILVVFSCISVRGRTIIKRTCYRDKIDTTCMDMTVESVKARGCYCNTDYCNGGDTVQPQVTTPVLRCYKCRSSDNDDCSDDNSDFSNIGTCQGTDITCVKEKLTVSGESIIERKCYMANHNEGCKVTTLGEYSYETCFCKSDHCNGIDGVRPYYLILLIVPLVVLLI